jgi:hypothetical protein
MGVQIQTNSKNRKLQKTNFLDVVRCLFVKTARMDWILN